MRLTLNYLLIVITTLSLSACDGFDYNTNDSLASTEQRFTRSELAFNVLFSSSLLNDSGFNNNRDGFIVLFDTADLNEIELGDNNNALTGKYPWTIVNDKLQVSYLDGVTCTSNKTSETASQYTVNSRCDGGEPNNEQIRNTLYKPVAFDEDDLDARTVTIDNNDTDQKIDFLSNGTYEITNLDTNGDRIANSIETGMYANATDISNVIKLELDNTNKDEYSLLILLDGSLTDGTLMQLSYVKSTDVLSEVRIYDIASNNRWDVDSLYNNINIDN